MSQLDPWQQVQAILRWSALPGASRHHWGTDVDVYDAAAVTADYTLQLTASEVTGGGPFVAMHEWLDQQIQKGNADGFFRPYQTDLGGIAPERWHLSFAPVAIEYQHGWNVDVLIEQLSEQSMALKSVVLEHIEEIIQRYVWVSPALYPDTDKQV
ncbi:M15 family metallopeptidase [Oceanicoccus sp. KOV_DT_Chl]|uniref:M15 family metallopeptidase n=1 Tax=Oceanicoccus sp. KOV_DT_Chl TaxID=1904639 RepID=UPI002100BD3C|nr:M15 family metallopeptidase [Oceanicoccus sp. KOV_DT_Chl]